MIADNPDVVDVIPPTLLDVAKERVSFFVLSGGEDRDHVLLKDSAAPLCLETKKERPSTDLSSPMASRGPASLALRLPLVLPQGGEHAARWDRELGGDRPHREASGPQREDVGPVGIKCPGPS